jgi:signal transduction histidine kinase
VNDDGVGTGRRIVPGERPADAPSGGTGLIGLFDRVDAHGGTLYVDRRSEGGTVLEVRLPCGS